MADQPDQPDQRPRNEIDLTPEDEQALDRAWATITDAEIEASIQWLDEIERERKQPPNDQQQEPPTHD